MMIIMSKFWEMVRRGKPGVLQSMSLQRVGHDWAEQQHDNYKRCPFFGTEIISKHFECLNIEGNIES